MMTDHDLMEWLVAKGSPTIKYRTVFELMDGASDPGDSAGHLVDDLLADKTVFSLLQKLECYGPIREVDNRTINAVHTGAGVEGIVARLIELGMKSGIPAFDARMQVFRQYVCNEFVDRALASPGGEDVANDRALFIAVLLASYFVHAGYEYGEIVSFVRDRIDSLYRMAAGRKFDIHLNETELLAYPKRAKCWSDTPVIRPECDPGCSEKPLPWIHDIYCMAYLPGTFIDEDLEHKRDSIIEYVLDDEFQALPQGYGLLWYKANRTYYACGWRPELPCRRSFDSEYEQSILVLYMELMSHFRVARESGWFSNCLDYLEQFRTPRGTYCFPTGFLKNEKDNNYVCGMSMGLGQNRRSADAYEIESTFRMLLIKKRANEL